MTEIDVRAPWWRWRTVTRRVEDIARQLAPQIVFLSGLPLPTCTIRLMSAPAYGRALRRPTARLAEPNRRDLDLSQAHDQQQRDAVAQQRRSADHLFRTAHVLVDPEGQPELLLMPTTARYSGSLGEWLWELLAHEMTHLAQYHAGSGGELWRLHGTAVPQAHGASDLALHPLMEAHANLVGIAAVDATLGRAPRRDPARRVWAAMRQRLGSQQSDETRQMVILGVKFLDQLYTRTGDPSVTDIIWRSPRLHAPTMAELSDPDAWLARVTAPRPSGT